MLTALFEFFSDLFFDLDYNGGYSMLTDMRFEVGGYEMPLSDYLSLYCSLISLIIILVLCCLFIWKIIKLVGGLIR